MSVASYNISRQQGQSNDSCSLLRMLTSISLIYSRWSSTWQAFLSCFDTLLIDCFLCIIILITIMSSILRLSHMVLTFFKTYLVDRFLCIIILITIMSSILKLSHMVLTFFQTYFLIHWRRYFYCCCCCYGCCCGCCYCYCYYCWFCYYCLCYCCCCWYCFCCCFCCCCCLYLPPSLSYIRPQPNVAPRGSLRLIVHHHLSVVDKQKRSPWGP